MATMLEVLNGASGRSAATSDKFPDHVLTGRYASGFTNSLMAKDVDLYLRAVEDGGGAAAIAAVTVAVWERFAAAEPGADFTRIYPVRRGIVTTEEERSDERVDHREARRRPSAREVARRRPRPPARRRRPSRAVPPERSTRTAPSCSASCTSTTRRRWRSAGSSAGWRCSAAASRPEIFRVTLDPAKNPAAEYLRGTFDWHLDGATDDIPIMATVLSAHAVAASGGETEFASTYAAYDDLSDDEQQRLPAAPRRAHASRPRNGW